MFLIYLARYCFPCLVEFGGASVAIHLLWSLSGREHAECSPSGIILRFGRQLLGAPIEMGSPNERPDLLGNDASNLGVCPCPVPTPYLDSYARTLDSALFPHLSRHPIAAAERLNGKKQARDWIKGQVREGVSNTGWHRKDLVRIIGIIFAQLFHRIGDCRLSSHVTPEMSYEIHELRRMVSGRRITVNRWTPGSRHIWDGALSGKWSPEQRSREEMALGHGGGPIRMGGEDILKEPAGDEVAPITSRGDLEAHSSYPLPGANWHNSGGGQQGGFTGNLLAPKRTGDATEAPSPQRWKLSEQNIRDQGDRESADKHQDREPKSDFMVTITELDIAHAGK